MAKNDDQQWIKLFRYLDRRFSVIDAQLENMATRTQLSSVYNLLDDRIKQESVEQTERAAMNVQLGRHEGWINQLAEKTDTQLNQAT